MSAMDQLDEIVDDYVRHVRTDYVGLWQIASRVREDLGLHDNHEAREKTLLVVRRLLGRGLHPGDYFKSGFDFWNEDDADSIIARIDREWDPVCGDPTLANPICWFGIK
jgi:hypothetical protein